jgi:hypothetical protein
MTFSRKALITIRLEDPTFWRGTNWKLRTVAVRLTAQSLWWESFSVDLAVGLEGALVKAFAPPWNKSKDGRLATETKSSELAAE